MTLRQLFTTFVLLVFATTFTAIPTAEAGKKSYKKSEKHSAKHSAKSKKSDKHSHKSKKKSNKKSQKKNKKNYCKVDNPDYVPGGKSAKSKKSKKDKKYLKHTNKSKKYHRQAGKNRPYILVPAGEFFLDLDGDGFGDSTITDRCHIEGYVASGGDCSVNDPLTFPGATEVCGDGIDNNCDGQIDEQCGPAVCPCGTASDIASDFFSSPDWFFAVPFEDHTFDSYGYGVPGGTGFELDSRIGPEGIGCRVTIETGSIDGYVIEEGPLTPEEVEACKTEIDTLETFQPL